MKDFFILGITLAGHEENRIRIGSSTYMPPAQLDPADMISLVQQYVSLDLGLEVHQLCDKLQELAATEDPAVMVMTKFFIPFTVKLYTMAAEQITTPVPVNLQDRVSVFTAEIINLFANRCVGPRFTPRAGCGCGCEMCLQVDSLLGNPSQEEFSISAGN